MRKLNLFAFLFALALTAGNANAATVAVKAEGPALSSLGCEAPGTAPCEATYTDPDGKVHKVAASGTSAPAADETCSVGWCPLVTAGSWLAGIGAILLEIGLGLAFLALLIGGAFYGLRRLSERRMDHKRRRSLGRLRARAQVANWRLDRATANNDQPNIDRWAARAIVRHNRYLAELERTGHPGSDGSRYDVPAPIVAPDEDNDEDADADAGVPAPAAP